MIKTQLMVLTFFSNTSDCELNYQTSVINKKLIDLQNNIKGFKLISINQSMTSRLFNKHQEVWENTVLYTIVYEENVYN